MLPFIIAQVNNRQVKALVDTGCEQSVLLASVCEAGGLSLDGPGRIVSMLNGETTLCKGTVGVSVRVGEQECRVSCLVAPGLVRDAEMILGMDSILRLGGVTVGRDVEFGQKGSSCASGIVLGSREGRLEIEDSDFKAVFDRDHWVVSWKWSATEPCLLNQMAGYSVSEEDREEYEKEVVSWINDGWLEEYDRKVHGVVDGVIPLMAAKQPNKPRKVRPVMDYRELNGWVKSNPGVNSVVCQEKLRSWRRRSSNACLLDLRKAYLQVHVDQSLQRFQAVKFKGKLYVMTRMGFGLSVAPKVMSRIVERVLSLDSEIERGTDHYIDDIWVDKDVVDVEVVRAHLSRYGLVAKDPEPLDDARVLGLRVTSSKEGSHSWKRDGVTPAVGEQMTKRQLFSLCGKLVGHYPVAGWLRTACSYLRRLTNECRWDDEVPEATALIAREIVNRVNEHDPVGGVWSVSNSTACKVWCDASSLAMGVCLEVVGEVVEDAAWLRKESDGSHINVAELEALLKGLTLALKWGFKQVQLITDSATVHGWVQSVLKDERRPRVSGLSEMVVRRRLGLLEQIRDEYGVEIDVRLVKSAENHADGLTRVPSKWLKGCQAQSVVAAGCEAIAEQVMAVHKEHHFGVERTRYLAERVVGCEVKEDQVKEVVQSCHICRSVDPNPVQWEHGSLEVERVWERLAADITFVNGQPYLSVVDCGPSRFAVWSRLTNETSEAVIRCLFRLFSERGPPHELLTDNGPCFSSRVMKGFLSEWGVRQLLSAAYRHSGNGIIERNHRTVKRSVARSGKSVEMAVYWYNNSPRCDGVVPIEEVSKYQVRIRGEAGFRSSRSSSSSQFSVGDVVFVKPPNARCTTKWRTGKVTGVVSNQVVEVDGTNRHVADIRLLNHDERGDDMADEQQRDTVGVDWNGMQCDDPEAGADDADDTQGNVPRRTRQPPERYGLAYTH